MGQLIQATGITYYPAQELLSEPAELPYIPTGSLHILLMKLTGTEAMAVRNVLVSRNFPWDSLLELSAGAC